MTIFKLKIIKLLIKLELMIAESCFKEDTIEYEDIIEIIKKHKREVERICKEITI